MKYVLPDIKGEKWIYDDEALWLFAQASKMISIVEVGSFIGRSTHALCSGCPGIVTAVDTWKGSLVEAYPESLNNRDIYEEFLANVGHFPNLRIMHVDSLAAVQQFPDKSIDMVFLDGDHTLKGASDDIHAWYPKCKKLLCGHDFGRDQVTEALEASGIQYKHELNLIWSVWL